MVVQTCTAGAAAVVVVTVEKMMAFYSVLTVDRLSPAGAPVSENGHMQKKRPTSRAKEAQVCVRDANNGQR